MKIKIKILVVLACTPLYLQIISKKIYIPKQISKSRTYPKKIKKLGVNSNNETLTETQKNTICPLRIKPCTSSIHLQSKMNVLHTFAGHVHLLVQTSTKTKGKCTHIIDKGKHHLFSSYISLLKPVMTWNGLSKTYRTLR